MCSDCVPPQTAAKPCSATRTTLFCGCCAVSVTPPVCVWKRSFSGTIAENVAFGRPDATMEEVAEATRAVGADAFVERMEHGLDTEVGERGAQLSAGQRQLIAFARALIADPRILVLDEATSNVDIQTETRIEHGLRRLLAGRTAVVIAHRLSTIRHAGLIVVLDGGRVVEQGTHDELLDARGAYYRLYSDWQEQAAA